ncbi:integrase catalytic domain-containing protein [Trichonephila clavipes]|uniref:Integrase catalytic domain-containing protein n=1 Tax=Trichonephila clavipes TaxID=2585209 RepID=A0A8X6VVW8_TRICX|nr:integrase catalytic domain-containing protein [Trichonephila clavipes]
MGNFNLTIEEFLTVVNQVEGILNSRPLIPLSSDPNDFSSLTPGHFLIGRPINFIPESKITDIPDNRLSRWPQVQKINQIIWKKWPRDYLNNLQQRV